MSRIKIEYNQEKTIFSTNLPILVNHLNYSGHMGYDAIFSLIQDARIRLFKKNNMRELSISGPVGYMVFGAFATYANEAFLDDELTISMYIDNLKKKAFSIIYEAKNQHGKIIATAQTDHMFFDFDNKKLTNAPENFLSAFE